MDQSKVDWYPPSESILTWNGTISSDRTNDKHEYSTCPIFLLLIDISKISEKRHVSIQEDLQWSTLLLLCICQNRRFRIIKLRCRSSRSDAEISTDIVILMLYLYMFFQQDYSLTSQRRTPFIDFDTTLFWSNIFILLKNRFPTLNRRVSSVHWYHHVSSFHLRSTTVQI